MESERDPHLLTLSTGVVLRLRAVSPFVVERMIAQIPVPEVPRQFVESKGREYENPDDPAYEKALKEYQSKRREMTLHACIVFGTEIVEIPEGIYPPDRPEWAEPFAEFGIEIAPEGRRRYIDWIQYYAGPAASDLVGISQRVQALSATPEEAVREAAERFRDNAQRSSAVGASDQARGQKRNPDGAAVS